MAQTKSCKRRMDWEQAIKTRAVAAAMHAHSKDLKALEPRFGKSIASMTDRGGEIQLYSPSALSARMAQLKKSESLGTVAELLKAERLGSVRQLAKPPCPVALNALRRDFPHFGEVLEVVKQHVDLANLTRNQVFELPPLLLSGDPGVGKTAFSEALAASMKLPLERVDLASTTAGFALAGNHETWAGAKHGSVWTLLQSESASGILLLDEIDKATDSKYPVLGPLYGLLEPGSASHFRDENIGLEIDASHLMHVATCNDDELLVPALRSRFRIFEIPAPSEEQMPAVIRSVFRQLKARKRWGEVFTDPLPDSVLGMLVDHTPRELTRVLETAVANAAAAGRRALLPEDLQTRTDNKAQTKTKLGFI